MLNGLDRRRRVPPAHRRKQGHSRLLDYTETEWHARDLVLWPANIRGARVCKRMPAAARVNTRLDVFQGYQGGRTPGESSVEARDGLNDKLPR